MPVSTMNWWLMDYADAHPGTSVATDGSVRLGPGDHVQPDVMMWRDKSDKSRLGNDFHLEGAPELVVEVAASSAAYDLHVKRQAYERAGVQEYLVWRTIDQAIDWFELIEGRYEPMTVEADGFTHSKVFPGLKMHIGEFLSGDASKRRRSLGL
jgi:Uma2 family endonuclease